MYSNPEKSRVDADEARFYFEGRAICAKFKDIGWSVQHINLCRKFMPGMLRNVDVLLVGDLFRHPSYDVQQLVREELQRFTEVTRGQVVTVCSKDEGEVKYLFEFLSDILPFTIQNKTPVAKEGASRVEGAGAVVFARGRVKSCLYREAAIYGNLSEATLEQIVRAAGDPFLGRAAELA